MLRHVVNKALLTKTTGVAVVVNANFHDLTDDIKDLPVVILSNHAHRLCKRVIEKGECRK